MKLQTWALIGCRTEPNEQMVWCHWLLCRMTINPAKRTDTVHIWVSNGHWTGEYNAEEKTIKMQLMESVNEIDTIKDCHVYHLNGKLCNKLTDLNWEQVDG